jgi:hypothetical protein
MYKNDAILVATSTLSEGTVKSAYAKELEMWEDDKRNARLEREMRQVGFGQRASYCG